MHMISELILLSLYVAGCSYDILCNSAFDLFPFHCRTGIKQCHKIAPCRIGCRDTIEIRTNNKSTTRSWHCVERRAG